MKIRWLVLLVIVLVMLSYLSTNFTTLNPRLGLWESAGQGNLTSGSVNIPGLSSPVNVTIDASGVAHIQASNMNDLMFAQGYYSASQRLFQMELEALLASGNLSKYIGASGVSSDQAMRLIGLPGNAWTLEQAYISDYPQYYGYLQSYSAGVNAYINTSSASNHLGFKLLGMQPFHWTVFYTLCWQQYMSWSLTTGAAEPLQSALIYNALGYQNATLLWPYYPYYTQNITMVPGDGTVLGHNLSQLGVSPNQFWAQNWYGQNATGVNTSLLNTMSPLIRGALANISDPFGMPGAHELGSPVGSNSWVVGGNYTKSRVPMMANDPHLPLTVPSIWIPMQLEAPGINVTGWDLAGIPGILIGHTSKTSWGLTTPEGNSANEYLETLHGNSYLYNGTWHSMAVQNYTLVGKSYSIYYTNNGPLISRNQNYGISLNWASKQPSFDLVAELGLDQSSNYSEMLKALQNWGSPPQNFAMATLHHVGYITAGFYPMIKEVVNNTAIDVIGSRSLLNGSNPAYEPIGNVPFNQLPQATNPSRGYMFAPNQPTVGKNYMHPFVGGFWASGGRAQTIYHFLKGHQNTTIQDMMALQSNVSDYWALMFAPYLVNALHGMTMNQTETAAYNQLSSWNYTTYQNQVGITVYWYLTAEMYNMTFDKVYSSVNLSSVPTPFITTAIHLVQTNQSSVWFHGNFTTLVRQAFTRETALLGSKLGSVNNWTWGRVHLLEIASPTGIAALGIGPIPIWGGSHTVSVGTVPRALLIPEPYVSVGSSLRTIASPGTGQFYGVMPGGPSENILSYYFSNQLNMWINHEYYNMNDQKAVAVIRYE